MSDITEAAVQDIVAESILDAPIVAVLSHEGNFVQRPNDVGSDAPHGESVFDNPNEYVKEAIFDQEHNPAVLGDEGVRQKLIKEGYQVGEKPEEFTKDEMLTTTLEERAMRRLEQLEERTKQAETSVQTPNRQQAQGQPRRASRELANVASAEELRELGLLNRGAKTGEAAQQREQEALPLTREQMDFAIQQTDEAIQEFGLNENAEQFAADLAPFLGNAVYQHAPELATMTARATIGARDAVLAAYESGALDPTGEMDFVQIAPVSPMAARESTRMLCDALGIDWQMNPPANEMLVANTIHRGLVNLIHAYVQSGGRTDPRELNDKRMCVWVTEALQAGLLGKNGRVNETKAVAFVNGLSRRVLDLLPRITAGLERRTAAQEKQPRPRTQRVPERFREGMKGSKAPSFATNEDIFSGPTVEAALTTKL